MGGLRDVVVVFLLLYLKQKTINLLNLHVRRDTNFLYIICQLSKKTENRYGRDFNFVITNDDILGYMYYALN